MNQRETQRERVMTFWAYPGASFGKRPEGRTSGQKYLADKAALMRAEKYYTSEEWAQLLSDLEAGRISLRIYEDGIVIDRRVG
jgi:hypothetical protein